MSLTFWFNNFHFALEFFGGTVFVVLAWLAFESLAIKKDFKTVAKGLGFALCAVWLVVHSLNIVNDLVVLASSSGYLLGLFLILLNLYMEMPPAIPKTTEVVFVLPAAAGVLWAFHIPATILLFLIAVLSFWRYRREFQATLLPFSAAFFLLAVAAFLDIFNSQTGVQEWSWFTEHLFRLISFGLLGYWGWQYLRLRIREEMLLIFVGMALAISITVTFTFSAILLGNMESEAKLNLVSNVKVLEYALSRMENEALSNAELFAKNEELKKLISKNDFAAMDKISERLMAGKGADFLLIADANGEVILRAHSLTAKGDNIKEEKAGARALAGVSYATVESTAAEGLSIRAASPIYDDKNKIAGIVIAGFVIDNAFVDRVKKNTGLEASVYWGDVLAATTISDADGKTRNIGAKQTDPAVLGTVLKRGGGLIERTAVFSRPYLASYLPLKNAEGETVGMLQASRLQTELADTAAAANRLTLLITIIITVMMMIPIYGLAKRLTE